MNPEEITYTITLYANNVNDSVVFEYKSNLTPEDWFANRHCGTTNTLAFHTTADSYVSVSLNYYHTFVIEC